MVQVNDDIVDDVGQKKTNSSARKWTWNSCLPLFFRVTLTCTSFWVWYLLNMGMNVIACRNRLLKFNFLYMSFSLARQFSFRSCVFTAIVIFIVWWHEISRLSIVNLVKAGSLYKEGMRPLMYSEIDAKESKIGWRRCGDNIAYFKNEDSSYV